MKKILGILLALVCVAGVYGAERETFVFDINRGDTLRLDLYRAVPAEKPAPVLIFAFGGGFMGGHRDDARYRPLFDYLTSNGVAVVSTDYRTRLKGLSATQLASPQAFADRLIDAVDCAVTDFFKATVFTAAHASEWGIDPSEMFACGSSAGAITVLQAESELCNSDIKLPGMPEGFNYAGIISFAGAVFSEGEPEWQRKPAPMLLFHGDADSNVPFSEATMGDYGFYGSKTIAESLARQGHNRWFHRIDGADHSVALSPMSDDCGEILDFIRDVVAGRLTTVDTVERVPGQAPYRTDFTIKDYIMSNLQ